MPSAYLLPPNGATTPDIFRVDMHTTTTLGRPFHNVRTITTFSDPGERKNEPRADSADNRVDPDDIDDPVTEHYLLTTASGNWLQVSGSSFISAEHVAIKCRLGHFFIKDMSTNGTWVHRIFADHTICEKLLDGCWTRLHSGTIISLAEPDWQNNRNNSFVFVTFDDETTASPQHRTAHGHGTVFVCKTAEVT